MPKLLTKSSYLIGLDSKAYLWMCVNDKNSLEKPDAVLQSRFDEGEEVGDYAKKLFNGIDLNGLGFLENKNKTMDLYKNNVLFEAGFQFERCYARIDILVPNGEGFDILEVKSTTRAKHIHAHDLSFQKYVLEKAGLKINNCILVHLNKDFVKKGEIDPKELFALTKMNNEVNALGDISSNINRMLEIIDSDTIPDFQSEEILAEYGNPLIEDFYDSLPDGSIFELYRLGKEKALDLWNNDIKLIKNIPEDYELNAKQKIQLLSQDKTVIQKDKLIDFLNSIKEPVCHMDFEAFQSAIPVYDGTKPYQQIPFQYSLHIEIENGLEHKEFLYEGEDDPRGSFIKTLLSDIPREGSILVYYRSFEVSRLREIADFIPELKEDIQKIISRIVDLIIPFQNFYYHNKLQKGSNSIKDVLPLFTEKNHSNLAIKNGGEAMLAYRNNRGNINPELKKDLLEYCEMDTKAMVIILRELRRLTENK